MIKPKKKKKKETSTCVFRDYQLDIHRGPSMAIWAAQRGIRLIGTRLSNLSEYERDKGVSNG